MFNLVPFNSSNNIAKSGDAFDRLFTKMFEHPFSMLNNFDTSLASFKVDVKETEEAYEVIAELPGIQKEDIALDYNQNYLVISADRNEECENKEENYIYRERHIGKFERSFYLDQVDKSKITAQFKDGILNVTLPKIEPNSRNSRIMIE